MWIHAVLDFSSFFALCPRLLIAAPIIFPALSGNSDARTLVVYSSLDEPLAKPMIVGFQRANPDVTVRYEDMLTGEIYDRIIKETDAGMKTADFAFLPPWTCRSSSATMATPNAATCR